MRGAVHYITTLQYRTLLYLTLFVGCVLYIQIQLLFRMWRGLKTRVIGSIPQRGAWTLLLFP